MHCSTHLKSNNNFLIPLSNKIIKLILFFSFFYSISSPCTQITHLPQSSNTHLLHSSLSLHQALITVAVPDQPSLRRPSSSQPSPAQPTPSQANPSLISLTHRTPDHSSPSLITVAVPDQPSPRRPSPSQPSLAHAVASISLTHRTPLQLISLTHHRRRPSPLQALISLIKLSTPSPSQPIHFRLVLSLFFCSEFFHGLIFLGLV